MQFKHFVFGCKTSDGFGIPFWLVKLVNRKGWQRHVNDNREGPLEGKLDCPSVLCFFLNDPTGNQYEIYSQAEMPQINVDLCVREWIDCLKVVYGSELMPGDFIFPAFSDGKLQRGVPISHDVIQQWILHFTSNAGVTAVGGKFTTHCFRRGGAQYRFMFAPIGKRWSLSTVRWWGGWAVGEHVSNPLLHFNLRCIY